MRHVLAFGSSSVRRLATPIFEEMSERCEGDISERCEPPPIEKTRGENEMCSICLTR